VDLGGQRGFAGGLVERALAQADRFGGVVDRVGEPREQPRALGAGRKPATSASRIARARLGSPDAT
jgi:hypothetical protein